MPSVGQGGTITLRALYRDGTGALVDPVTPLLDILDPAAAVVVNGAVPVRDALGSFSYVHSVALAAAVGNWSARWSGVINGGLVYGTEVFAVGAPGTVVVTPGSGTSASTSGALKKLLEGAGLGVAVYRDRAPEGTKPPYLTVSEALFITPEPAFNAYSDPEAHVSERVQVSVWQQARDNTTRRVTENYELPDAVMATLTAAGLPSAPTQVHGVRVSSRIRLYEEKTNVVHDAITLDVRRVLQRSV